LINKAKGFAFADDDQPSDLLTLEPIQVTGTRITRKELEASTPITLVDRHDIERMGTTDIGELLQSLPMMSGSPLSSGRNIDSDPICVVGKQRKIGFSCRLIHSLDFLIFLCRITQELHLIGKPIPPYPPAQYSTPVYMWVPDTHSLLNNF